MDISNKCTFSIKRLFVCSWYIMSAITV